MAAMKRLLLVFALLATLSPICQDGFAKERTTEDGDTVTQAGETSPETVSLEAEESQSELVGADVAWMLTCSALVLMMTAPGLALFYGGLVRKKIS